MVVLERRSAVSHGVAQSGRGGVVQLATGSDRPVHAAHDLTEGESASPAVAFDHDSLGGQPRSTRWRLPASRPRAAASSRLVPGLRAR